MRSGSPSRAHRARRAALLRQREEWYWRWFGKIMALGLVLALAFWAGVIFVAWHFLGKFW